MIKTLKISGYKSIQDVSLTLGRINVFIGENGSGKSNILEAIALAGAAGAEKLDNEFLTSRGIRVTQPQFMHPAFTVNDLEKPISVSVSDQINNKVEYRMFTDKGPYPKWRAEVNNSQKTRFDIDTFPEIITEYISLSEENINKFQQFVKTFGSFLEEHHTGKGELKLDKPVSMTFDNDTGAEFTQFWISHPKSKNYSNSKEWDKLQDNLSRFLVYSPENSSLRTFEREGQVEPLGINGEGLLKLLLVISSEKNSKKIKSIKESLGLLGWFGDFRIVDDPNISQGRMEIKDKFVHKKLSYFDQRSSNEGFLFLLFYFTLFNSDLTPPFFAIDNIDASLNPKLCETLVKALSKIAVENEKQVIMTTHNPSVLDGLNLDDDNQKLFVIYRGSKGQTIVRNIVKPVSSGESNKIRLSEAFLRGSLGGLPKHF